jgi:hypothetical protein
MKLDSTRLDYCSILLLLLSTTWWRQSQSHIATDGQSTNQSVLVSSPRLGLMAKHLLLFDRYSLVIVGRPL